MCMWYKFLSEWDRVSLFLDDRVVESADMYIFADATDTSFGGIFDSRCFQEEIEEVRNLTQSHSITYCE